MSELFPLLSRSRNYSDLSLNYFHYFSKSRNTWSIEWKLFRLEVLFISTTFRRVEIHSILSGNYSDLKLESFLLLFRVEINT